MIKLLRSYLFWTYERGSFHYDVMVTLILLFLFVGPRFIDFKDKPVETVPFRSSEVLVTAAGSNDEGRLFIYQIRAEDLRNAKTESDRQDAILRVVESISGQASLQRYEPVRDVKGNVIAYNAWVLR
jgi:hypothetical protein